MRTVTSGLESASLVFFKDLRRKLNNFPNDFKQGGLTAAAKVWKALYRGFTNLIPSGRVWLQSWGKKCKYCTRCPYVIRRGFVGPIRCSKLFPGTIDVFSRSLKKIRMKKSFYREEIFFKTSFQKMKISKMFNKQKTCFFNIEIFVFFCWKFWKCLNFFCFLFFFMFWKLSFF